LRAKKRDVESVFNVMNISCRKQHITCSPIRKKKDDLVVKITGCKPVYQNKKMQIKRNGE
jgi:hypothetical protein